jgi:hypothetical protein
MTKRLLAIWQKFEQESLATAPMGQRQEMQKTFYWGAATLLSILQEIPDGASEEEGAAVFEELYQECRDYMKQPPQTIAAVVEVLAREAIVMPEAYPLAFPANQTRTKVLHALSSR